MGDDDEWDELALTRPSPFPRPQVYDYTKDVEYMRETTIEAGPDRPSWSEAARRFVFLVVMILLVSAAGLAAFMLALAACTEQIANR